MSKREVFEVREPVDGERSPSGSDLVLPQKSGSSQDHADMHRMGKQQQLNRAFNSVSILGLTCVIMATWQAILSTSTFSLINGGKGGSIWLYLATWFFTMLVTASMAEMQSMAPTSGGQYHWVSEFAPPSIQKTLSYISGWLSALGWQAFIASAAFGTGQLILLCASTANPSFVFTAWQGTLLTFAIAIFAAAFNTFLAKRLPVFEGIVLFFHIIGFFAMLIPLWVLAPKSSASEVFGDFQNYGGWSSIGTACIVGQLAASSAFVGVDSAAHMSEEVNNASVTVPRMMIGTVVINGALGFVAIITYMFVIQDVETQILGSTAVYPWIEVFAVATGSTGGAIGMTIPIIIISFGMTINATAAASRQAWSFARDKGLPFPDWFTKVTSIDKVPLPLNAMAASMFICFILALLNLGGSEVFNSIIGLMNGAVGFTYAISIGCVLWRRLFGEPLPPARWSFGWFGVPCNVIAFLYQLFTTIISFFPIFAQVTAKSMNWGIAMFGGVAIIAAVYYTLLGRKVYRGPVVNIIKY
ncbi:amino acid transporter [Polychaeton citri CBS 116435]|uniref:Amino acid transporter n=1 Tax=Polychaeton citri CBS 116435 TaxID=1314669 RepID=A0A9P4QBS0_9PEZI|nr:amino acid transporter [Polychaeton citri CBS 116435]